MTPTAAYDEIADWYEQEFIARQRAGGGRADADPLGIDRALGDLLGQGGGTCLDIGCGTGVHAAGFASWAGRPWASTCLAGCSATPGADLPAPGPMPSGCRSATSPSPPSSR